jgi:hypothetical protein
MARIRSIHPGLFTDEAFASLSMGARVLLLGVWTEADDHGVFEWKPVTLKMRVMPVDNVSIPELLAECERADVIKRFTSGKSYGLVRNFCRYQRPKKPKYVHPIPPELYTYAGLKPDGSLVVLHQSRTSGESEPQRDDGGGEGEEESGNEISNTRVFFDEFWSAYPRRDSDEQQDRAEEKFNALVKTGVDPKVITFGARAYCAKVRKQNTYATRYVKQAWRWLADQDFTAISGGAAAPDEPHEPADKDWRSAVKRWMLNESNWPRWAGNTPGSASCRCPPAILAELGVCPNTARRIDATWHFAEFETPELAANLSFAAEHHLKIRLYKFNVDGVEKDGAHFMVRFPPGYDEATGEKLPPQSEEEENAA